MWLPSITRLDYREGGAPNNTMINLLNTKFWRSLGQREHGFTLIEVVVATFIAGTVVVGSVVLMGTAVRSSDDVSGSLDLQQLVQTQIEILQQVPFSQDGVDYPLLSELLGEDFPDGVSISFETSDSGTNYQFPNPDGEFVRNVVQQVKVTATEESNSVTMTFYKIIVP